MAENDWKSRRAILAAEYPVLLGEDGEPWSTASLDDGLEKKMHDRLQKASESGVNKQFVEDLLADCMNRIANCISLRDRAYDLEVRAIDDAENYVLQKASLKANKDISDALKDVQHEMASNALSAQLNGDTLKFVGDAGAWQKVRAIQNSVTRDQEKALEARRDRSTMKGSASHYLDRFNLIKRLYIDGMAEVYVRCIACEEALKAIYEIAEPLPTVTHANYLDELTAWVQRVSDKLDAELASRYLCEIGFALWNGSSEPVKPEQREIATEADFKQWVTSGNYKFSLKNEHFQNMKDVRLRSARVVVKVGTDEVRTRTWATTLQPPSSDLLLGDEAYPCNASTSFSPGSGTDVFGVHNLRAIGQWQLELAPRSLGDKDPVAPANVYLYLRVSYKRPSAGH